MKDLKCAICGGKAGFRVLYRENFDYGAINEEKFSARRLPEKCHYRLLKCKKCGLVYSSPILDPEEIERLYKKSKLNYGTEVQNIKETYGRYLREAMRFAPGRESLLEIGCGSGFFLEKALELGFRKVRGVEPSRNAVEKADAKVRGAIINDMFRPGMFKKDSFDMVCFFQTIDHVVEPNGLLQDCYRILKPGGIVFCISHNTGALSTKALGESSPIFDIEHVYLFDKATIQRIFEKNGFRVIKVMGISNTYSIGYWAGMLPLPSPIKEGVLAVLGIAGLGRKKATIPSGNIGIIAAK